MPRLSRYPPTLSTTTAAAIAHGVAAILWPSRYAAQVEKELRAAYPTALPIAFANGRSALAVAISTALRATGRRRVVLPAYTSFSVAAAAAAAGSRVCLCDLDPMTLDFDRRDLLECVDRDTAAVVLGNIYGFPSRTDDLGWLRDRGVIIIDDAAQALGATANGVPVGGRGDLGVLSFGRGKCVTTGDGGALLVNNPDLKSVVSSPSPASTRGFRLCLIALAVWLSRSPMVFGLLSRMPTAQIGESVYDPDFHIAAAPPATNGLAFDLWRTACRSLVRRTRVAHKWIAALGDDGLVTIPARHGEATPAYLRLPVLAPDRREREDLTARLSKSGLAYVGSYPTSLAGIPEFRRSYCEDRATPAADNIADLVIALPCNGHLATRDIERAAEILRTPRRSILGSSVSTFSRAPIRW